MEGVPACVLVVAGLAVPCQGSGLLKPTANGSGTLEPAVSSEAHFRRRSLGDVYGPLSSTPDYNTPDTPQKITTVFPADKRHNNTPIYVPGVSDMRGFLAWFRDLCLSGLSAQIKGERIMLVPKTAHCFRATVRALRSLDKSKGEIFTRFLSRRTDVSVCC